jgi:hypothetical protein
MKFLLIIGVLSIVLADVTIEVVKMEECVLG